MMQPGTVGSVYLDVTETTNPYSTDMNPSAMEFFRLRE